MEEQKKYGYVRVSTKEQNEDRQINRVGKILTEQNIKP